MRRVVRPRRALLDNQIDAVRHAERARKPKIGLTDCPPQHDAIRPALNRDRRGIGGISAEKPDVEQTAQRRVGPRDGDAHPSVGLRLRAGREAGRQPASMGTADPPRAGMAEHKHILVVRKRPGSLLRNPLPDRVMQGARQKHDHLRRRGTNGRSR